MTQPHPILESPLGFVPQLLPTDVDGFTATDRWKAAIVAAPQVVNPGTRDFVRRVRENTDLLLVDPRTSTYQFEGYMSMEEARAVPYSPGRGTLGSLWQPSDFADRAGRARLIDAVVELQMEAGAGLPLAPYFAVPATDHPWLRVAADCARETLEVTDGQAGVVVQVELDALLSRDGARVLDTFGPLRPALGLLIVTDFDERQASPTEARAVLDLVAGLATAGWRVMPAYTGRFGLVAMTAGAVGAAGGGLELEAYPRRYLREGFINLKANAHYLPGAMVRMPVRDADRLLREVPEADPGAPAPSGLVYRRRLQAALDAKRREAEALLTGEDARGALRDRLLRALERCRRAAERLAESETPIRSGAYHYLEVLAELVGGPEAILPEDPGF